MKWGQEGEACDSIDVEDHTDANSAAYPSVIQRGTGWMTTTSSSPSRASSPFGFFASLAGLTAGSSSTYLDRAPQFRCLSFLPTRSWSDLSKAMEEAWSIRDHIVWGDGTAIHEGGVRFRSTTLLRHHGRLDRPLHWHHRNYRGCIFSWFHGDSRLWTIPPLSLLGPNTRSWHGGAIGRSAGKRAEECETIEWNGSDRRIFRRLPFCEFVGKWIDAARQQPLHSGLSSARASPTRSTPAVPRRI